MTLPFQNSCSVHSHYASYKPQRQPFFTIFINIANPSPNRRRRPPPGVRMDSSSAASTSTSTTPATTTTTHHNILPHHYNHHRRRQKEKLLAIVGATGCGKTKVSIDLATRFFPNSAEIINSDKMQLYNGLDITTNKISVHDRRGVPHHFLGDVDPLHWEFTPAEFRFSAALAVSDIVSRNKLPILVGGSNSFIHALLVDRFNPDFDVFDGSDPVSTHLRYNCCLLWVDVSFPVLCDYLCHRVDEMLDSGMFEELAEYYNKVSDPKSQPGLGKAIGVPEFEKYFKRYPPWRGGGEGRGTGEWDEVRRGVYEDAVREIKENTCRLAKRQMGKIMRLKRAGWDLQRVDATASFREIMTSYDFDEDDEDNNNSENDKIKKKKRKTKKRWMEIWGRDVVEPSVKIVKKFLEEEQVLHP